MAMMAMKKNGKLAFMVLGFLSLGYILGEINKKNFTHQDNDDKINLEQYLNRLSEFDLTEEKEATALFLDLIENGFYPKSAFNTVQKECLEAGEIF
jgi:hypothetical protein